MGLFVWCEFWVDCFLRLDLAMFVNSGRKGKCINIMNFKFIWVDVMATTSKEQQTASFSWMVPGEQVLGQSGKVHVYDRFARMAQQNKYGALAGNISGYRAADEA